MSDLAREALVAEAERLERKRADDPDLFSAKWLRFFGTHMDTLLSLLYSDAAKVQELEALVDEFWRECALGHDIEPREFFEREAPQQGFSSPIAMALHHIWKRDAKVKSLLEDRDRLAAEVERLKKAIDPNGIAGPEIISLAEAHRADSAKIGEIACALEEAEADVTRLTAQQGRLVSALKLVRVVPRPWIDGMAGQGGTVTYAKWESAISQINTALDDMDTCLKCGHPRSWHRHDDANNDPPETAPFRCLGYDCEVDGYPGGTPSTRCGCPDFKAELEAHR